MNTLFYLLSDFNSLLRHDLIKKYLDLLKIFIIHYPSYAFYHWTFALVWTFIILYGN